MAKQVHIDEEKIQNTQIVVTVKTLWAVLGVLGAGLFFVYQLITTQISDVDGKVDKAVEKIDNVSTNVTTLVNSLEKEEVKPLKDKVNHLDKEVGIVMDRTNSRHTDLTNSRGPSLHLLDTTSGPPSN